MIFNYLKIAARNITRSFSSTVINVCGLALGITCGVLLFSIIQYHLSFDNFHAKSDRIYRFVTEQHRDEISYTASVPPAFGKAFRDDYTFGEKVARICTLFESQVTVEQDGTSKKFKENVSFAESEFFEIFNFPVLTGQATNVLSEPNTAIVTERIAKKYFGGESALNKVIIFNTRLEFKITGILKDIPNNTDFRSEIYLSYPTIGQYNAWYGADDSWGGITSDIQTFVRLHPGVTAPDVEKELPSYVKKYRPKSPNVHHYKLQPLDEMHFDPRYDGKISKTTIGVLAVIGAFLIFTACLNFINLATAQAINRAREVGVRKALGSARSQLFFQFTVETTLIVLISAVIAFCVAYASIPYINTLFDSHISLNLFSNTTLLAFLAGLVIVVIFLAGSYPGFILSGFKPVLALKGEQSSQKRSNFSLRRVLIVAQFTIAQVLMIGLLVIVYQMKFFEETDMGFNHDAVIMMPIGSRDDKMNLLRDQLKRVPGVESVTACFSAPASNSRWGTVITFDNRTEPEAFASSFKGADENFLTTFDIELVAGRNLTPSDTIREFLVNETMVKKLGLSAPEDALGKIISSNGKQGPVVGVVSDFHDMSLHSAISPVFIGTSRENYNEFAVKINMKNTRATLAALEKVWTDAHPELMFDYTFLDKQTAEFYKGEQTILRLIQVFSLIALFIGCMGLYGLVSYMAIQRTKEIGIRKVLGGSIANILWIFGKEFFSLILIAFALAAPIGWWIMSQWLQNYTYRFDMSWWLFALEIAIISIIAMLTVGFRSAKAAMMNPAAALRTE
jgi:predicted permease